MWNLGYTEGMDTMKTFKEKFAKISLGKCLDVGTRNGEFLIKLKENAKNFTDLVGIDYNGDVIEKNNDNIKQKDIEFLSMDGSHMTFEDNTFDTVCISNTLHHAPNSDTILMEMMRILKPGGFIIINEMFSDNQNEKQLTHLDLHHLSADMDQLLGKNHYHTYKQQEIVDIVKNTGAHIYDVFEYHESETFKNKLIKKIDNLDSSVEKTASFPEYNQFIEKAQSIKERYNKLGLLPCTQLIVIGQK